MLYKIVLVVIVLVLLVYYMPVKMIVKTIRKDDNDVMLIRLVCLYGLLKLKYEVPYVDLIFRRGKAGIAYKSELKQPADKKIFAKAENTITIEQIKRMYNVYKINKTRIRKAVDYILSKTKIHDLTIIFKIGTGDAAATALAYGLSCIVIGSALSVLYNRVEVTSKDIAVKPVFDSETLNLELSCIITMRLGHIINTGIKLLPVLFSMRRNRTALQGHRVQNA